MKHTLCILSFLRAPSALLLALVVLTPALAAQEEAESKVERRIQVVFSDGENGTHEHMWIDPGDVDASMILAGNHDLPAFFLHQRTYLGVHLLDITPELREHFGAGPEAGVLVSGVADDSPAAAAGIEVGDVLVSIDGEEVGRTSQVLRKIGRHEADEAVSVGLVRDRRSLSVEATLAERPRSQVDLGPMFWTPGEGERRVLRLPNRIIEIEKGDLDEAFSELHQRLESPEWQERLEATTNARRTLENRIRELEKRLQEMEKRLEEDPD